MQSLIASRAFDYGRLRLRPGDRFQAAERDAQLLVTMRRAEYAVDDDSRPLAPNGTEPHEPYDRRDEAPAVEPTKPSKPKKKRGSRRGYLRRDERAQE